MPTHPYPKFLCDHIPLCLELLRGKETLNPDKAWLKGNEDVWPDSRGIWQCLKMSFQLPCAEKLHLFSVAPGRKGYFSLACGTFCSCEGNSIIEKKRAQVTKDTQTVNCVK